jgi:hypothetical protein
MNFSASCSCMVSCDSTYSMVDLLIFCMEMDKIWMCNIFMNNAIRRIRVFIILSSQMSCDF